MSKRKYYGTELDQVLMQGANRIPAYRVVCWNPNRTNIHDVVLGKPESPQYDITDWVKRIDYNENIVFENNDDAVASSCTLYMSYDANALPIEITEKSMLDSTPIRIYQGDERIPQDDWVPIFTGVIRGVPSVAEHIREDGQDHEMVVTCVDRAEPYLNKVVTARDYEQGMDVGKAAVETAIDWMYLDRREIKIGFQNYPVGHTQSQLVDIEVLKGIAQILFTTGKKPRFNSEGFLVAADTDLDRVPARIYQNKDLIIAIRREQVLSSIYNSIRLLGLDDELTEVVERVKRLAHGSITAGFFEDKVEDWVYFSETDGKATGGRRAKNTYLANAKISTVGGLFGESLSWSPELEEDEYTVFRGKISFDTGYDAEIRMAITGIWLAAKVVAIENTRIAEEAQNADQVWAAEAAQEVATGAEIAASAAMVALLFTLTELGRVYYEIHGEPFNNVYQQLASVAQLNGILTEDIHELELRNDWLYDIDYMDVRSRELLKRELIKGWSYEIDMLDDPLIEVDDILDIDGLKFYVTSIRKVLARPGDGRMQLTAWRLE